ncbi:MAG: methyl-accepting chemotaxis protein [Candidatus Omnitrophica bacterium]|nr:methyl-accepting chemotaxis protein [Candidatus Omnitrophota bacterium]
MVDIKNRRRNYYIDKEFQAVFILKFCSLVAIGSVISGLIIYAMSRATVTTTFENSRLTMKSTADFILPAVFLSSVVVIILIGLAAIIMTLFVSHKIAGPLYRLDKDVQDVASGNLGMVFRLRTGDEIRPLAASLNEMVAVIRERVSEAKKNIDDAGLCAGLPAEAREKIALAKESLKKLKT